jgi:glutathione S-transferase
MAWVHLVTLLALFEYMFFIYLVGKARERYGIKAPAISGNDMFERYFRVQMNTLELLIIFIPGLWMAAAYWNPAWVAAVGAVYLIGRALYLRGYVADPKSRSWGFMLSAVPIMTLLLGVAIGVVRGLTGL